MTLPRRRQLAHITLQTGDIAMIPASHVQPATLAALRPVVAALLATGEADIPRGWRITGAASGRRALSAQIWGSGGRVAAHSREGAEVWRAMHRMGEGVRTDGSHQPVTPWLATRILPGAMSLTPDQMAQLADLQECLAWTWLMIE